MLTIHIFAGYLHSCNPHFCLYGAVGITFLARCAHCFRHRMYDEAREHGFSGIVHLLFAILSLW